MPSVQFFTMLEYGRKFKRNDFNTLLRELCSVTAIAISDKKYHDELRGFYNTALLDKTEEPSENSKVLQPKGLDGSEGFARISDMVAMYGR